MASREQTQRHFGDGAADYYRLNYEQPRNRHELTLSLRRADCLRLVPETTGLVLDLGCGPGAMTVPLVQRGLRTVSADFAVKMAVQAGSHVERLGSPARSVAADAMCLPFRDATFSVVVTTGVLEYVPSLETALDEIARVLEPGGTVIATMSLPRRFERLSVKAYSALRGRSDGVKQYIYGRESFDSAIEAAGLRIDTSVCSCFAPFPLDALYPPSVTLIDKLFGGVLNRSEFAKDRAKTYIVRATRSPESARGSGHRNRPG